MLRHIILCLDCVSVLAVVCCFGLDIQSIFLEEACGCGGLMQGTPAITEWTTTSAAECLVGCAGEKDCEAVAWTETSKACTVYSNYWCTDQEKKPGRKEMRRKASDKKA